MTTGTPSFFSYLFDTSNVLIPDLGDFEIFYLRNMKRQRVTAEKKHKEAPTAAPATLVIPEEKDEVRYKKYYIIIIFIILYNIIILKYFLYLSVFSQLALSSFSYLG